MIERPCRLPEKACLSIVRDDDKPIPGQLVRMFLGEKAQCKDYDGLYILLTVSRLSAA